MTDAILSFPWREILMPELSWAEKLVRPLLVYLVLLLIFRLANKREMASATVFDFLIILMISNVVQNAMIGNDNSVLGAAAGAAILVILSSVLNRVTSRSVKVRALLEGSPVLLVQEGKVEDEVMKQFDIPNNDLLAAIRKQGIIRLSDVAFAILELDGSISVIKTDDDKRPHDCLPFEVAGKESYAAEDTPAGETKMQHEHGEHDRMKEEKLPR
ncbi:MAG: YetF domain-containing protein [Pseudomonadota bacterium]